MTKMVENTASRESAVAASPTVCFFIDLSLPSRRAERFYLLSSFRECCVSAKGLIDLEWQCILQFEWYRGYYRYSSQSETCVSFWGVFYLCFFDCNHYIYEGWKKKWTIHYQTNYLR
jgi:hypothetical protein